MGRRYAAIEITPEILAKLASGAKATYEDTLVVVGLEPGKGFAKALVAAAGLALSDVAVAQGEQMDRLSTYIMEHVNGEPSRSEGAGETAVRLLEAMKIRLDGLELKVSANEAELVPLREIAGRVERGDDLETIRAIWNSLKAQSIGGTHHEIHRTDDIALRESVSSGGNGNEG